MAKNEAKKEVKKTEKGEFMNYEGLKKLGTILVCIGIGMAIVGGVMGLYSKTTGNETRNWNIVITGGQTDNNTYEETIDAHGNGSFEGLTRNPYPMTIGSGIVAAVGAALIFAARKKTEIIEK